MRTLLLIMASCSVILSCTTPDHVELPKQKSPAGTGTGKNLTMARIGAPVQTSPGFVWGINGHPLTQEAYSQSKVSYSSQLDYLSTLGLASYRMDISANPDGSAVRESDLISVLNLASQKNIRILPMVYLVGLDTTGTESAVRAKGYNLGYGFASRYGSYFTHIEMGNEQENQNRMLVSGSDGSQTSNYDMQKFKLLAAFWEGMNFGIKEAQPSIKTLINCAGYYHYGLFELINNYTFEGRQITYDIIGYHWYSEMGDLTGKAKNFQGSVFDLLASRYPEKDIWITEANRRNGSLNQLTSGDYSFLEPADKKNAEAFWIDRYINQVKALPNVKAFFVHELLEQPAYDDGIPYDDPTEAYFGVIEFLQYSTNPSNRRLQPACFEIREQTLGYVDYVRCLYRYFDKREADGDGLNYWVGRIKQVDSSNDNDLLSFIDGFLREEAYGVFINDTYQHYLGHAGDSGGISYWTSRLKTDLTREQVIAKFCSGSEFAGSLSDSDYLDKLHKKLLNRQVDAAGLQYFSNKLQSGVSKESVVLELLSGEEYLRRFISSQYSQLIRRSIDDQFQDYLLGKMINNGLNQQGLIDQFGISNIFWEQSIKEGLGE